LRSSSHEWRWPRADSLHQLEAGFEQRVRNQIWDNILDFNEAKDDYMNQIRWRTRFAQVGESWQANGELAWQHSGPRGDLRKDAVVFALIDPVKPPIRLLRGPDTQELVCAPV
jgi:hypothetical protein